MSLFDLSQQDLQDFQSWTLEITQKNSEFVKKNQKFTHLTLIRAPHLTPKNSYGKKNVKKLCRGSLQSAIPPHPHNSPLLIMNQAHF